METKKHLSIRDAHDSERNAIREVTQAAYEQYATIMSAAFWAGYKSRLLAALDEEGPVERIVAVQDGTIVGSVLLYPASANVYTGLVGSVTWPEVRLLAVLPAVRGQGIGTALMDECERRAFRAGATVLGLHTMDTMEAAVRMYERMGFVRAHELDFRPVENVLVKGYRRNIARPS